MNAIAEPTPASFSNAVVRYCAATRPPFVNATLVACLLGLATARHSGISIDIPLAVVTVLLASLTHAAVNVLNDYYDALNGTDDANTARIFPFTGGSRFIQNGVLTREQTARFGYTLMLTSLAGGLWLMQHTSSALMFIGAAGLFVGWAYSAEPLRLNSRGLGEICVLLGFTGVVAGADLVQRQTFTAEAWLIGIPYGLLVTNLLYINQFPDRNADALAGKRNWVVRLPLPAAARIYSLLAGLALGVLWMLVQRDRLPPVALVSALPLLLSLRAAILLQRHAGQPAALGSAIRLTLAAMLTHGMLLAVILWWSAA
jgi:1,4-dihydroxy-2-naphthoate polyprenyltransferase